MDRGLEPPPAVTGGACAHVAVELPHDLAEGLAAFETSSVARAALGESVHQRFAMLARHERDFARRSVTDWDLRRYFECLTAARATRRAPANSALASRVGP